MSENANELTLSEVCKMYNELYDAADEMYYAFYWERSDRDKDEAMKKLHSILEKSKLNP